MFRNWRPTRSCGSCQCPPLSPAPQVSDAALTITCMFRCNYKGTRQMEVFFIKCKTDSMILCISFPADVFTFGQWTEAPGKNRWASWNVFFCSVLFLPFSRTIVFCHSCIMTCVFLLWLPKSLSSLLGKLTGVFHTLGEWVRQMLCFAFALEPLNCILITSTAWNSL